MRIEDVITEVVIAIYGSPSLAERLILKGGSAMRMFDEQNARLSIDADFSIEDVLTKTDPVFREMEDCFAIRFATHGFDLIDFKAAKRPKKLRQGFPEWWGGWACEFKLVDKTHSKKTLETRRRNALIPEGANSPKIQIDLSIRCPLLSYPEAVLLESIPLTCQHFLHHDVLCQYPSIDGLNILLAEKVLLQPHDIIDQPRIQKLKFG